MGMCPTIQFNETFQWIQSRNTMKIIERLARHHNKLVNQLFAQGGEVQILKRLKLTDLYK